MRGDCGLDITVHASPEHSSCVYDEHIRIQKQCQIQGDVRLADVKDTERMLNWANPCSTLPVRF
jgi:hypothetical protein